MKLFLILTMTGIFSTYYLTVLSIDFSNYFSALLINSLTPLFLFLASGTLIHRFSKSKYSNVISSGFLTLALIFGIYSYLSVFYNDKQSNYYGVQFLFVPAIQLIFLGCCIATIVLVEIIKRKK